MSIASVLKSLDNMTDVRADMTAEWRSLGNAVVNDAKANLKKASPRTAANLWPGAGQRRGHTTKSVSFKATPYDLIVGTDRDAGVYQEFGTEDRAPHTIRPKKKKRLVFPVPRGQGHKKSKNGRFDWVFARIVTRHPGVPAKHWLSNAAKSNEEKAMKILGEAFADRVIAAIQVGP